MLSDSSLQKSRNFFLILILTVSVLFFFLPGFAAASPSPDGAVYSEHFGGLNETPRGAIFLIVDGLGSYYLFPELKAESLSGEPAGKASLQTFSKLQRDGFRVSKMVVPVPVTDKGHSVLVTGDPKADPEMVGYEGSTFMDVLRAEGFLCIGVMQRGDFESMRRKFDVILYDKTNSANNMNFTVQKNDFAGSDREIVDRLENTFMSLANNVSEYADSKNTSEKYAGYNRFALDAASEALAVMENYPDQKFILVVNVGGVDSTGHYRGYAFYLEAVENLDRDAEKLIEKCRRNRLFFILTADHGMSFESLDKKSGGHSSAKYAKAETSLHIPFIVYGDGVSEGMIYEKVCGQEDVAATLLSLFNLFERPRFSKGNVLPAKERAVLRLHFPEPEFVSLYRASENGESLVFPSGEKKEAFAVYSLSGLIPGDYRLKWDGSDRNYTQRELHFSVEADTEVDLAAYLAPSAVPLSVPAGFPLRLTKTAGILLIGAVNLIGGAAVYRIYRKNR